jgi:hypothetical protein
MTDAEFDAWLPSVQVGYAEELIMNGIMDPAAARVKADAATAQFFPGGQPSPEQLVFVIEAGGERVGELWLAGREERLRRVLWVYELRVRERYRGRGLRPGVAASSIARAESCCVECVRRERPGAWVVPLTWLQRGRHSMSKPV